MLQLIERGSRDHALDLAERFVGTQAVCVGRHTQPHLAAAALHRAGQSAIVDDLTTDRRNSACARQRFRTDQHAATGSACHLCVADFESTPADTA